MPQVALASADSGLNFSSCVAASNLLCGEDGCLVHFLPGAVAPEVHLELAEAAGAEVQEVPGLADDHGLFSATPVPVGLGGSADGPGSTHAHRRFDLINQCRKVSLV